MHAGSSGGSARWVICQICLCLLTLQLMACTPRPRTALIEPKPALELTEVPFFPQEDYQCGPAALAEVLQWSGVDVTPERLTPKLFIPDRKGSLQVELQAQTRVLGRVPFRVRGDLQALYAELAAGHPVLVLQNLAFDWRPVWHYAVVVGIDPGADTVTLRSGRERRHEVNRILFERTWARADNWALIVLPANQLPATAEPGAVLDAVLALEQLQYWPMAEALYSRAAQRWPERAVFQIGYAHSRYAQGVLADAERAYRQVIENFPDDPVGYNNLALVLTEQKRWDEAEQLIERGLALGGPLHAELQDTQRQIACRRAGDCK